MTSKNDAQFLMAYLHSKDYVDQLETLTQQKMLENIVAGIAIGIELNK